MVIEYLLSEEGHKGYCDETCGNLFCFISRVKKHNPAFTRMTSYDTFNIIPLFTFGHLIIVEKETGCLFSWPLSNRNLTWDAHDGSDKQ